MPRVWQSLWFTYHATSKSSEPITVSMISLLKNYQNQLVSSKISVGVGGNNHIKSAEQYKIKILTPNCFSFLEVA